MASGWVELPLRAGLGFAGEGCQRGGGAGGPGICIGLGPLEGQVDSRLSPVASDLGDEPHHARRLAP